MISYHDDVKRNSFYIQLLNLRPKGLVSEHIQQFQKLSLKVEGIPNDKLLDLFIGTLNNHIQHEVHLFEPPSLENDFMMERKVESKNTVVDTRNTTSNTYKENDVPSKQPRKFTPQQLEERREKVLFFNCDNKYSKGHKCG